MGKTYTAKISVSCLKQHTCVACDTKFSYHLVREISGTGGTEQAAVMQAEKLAANSVEGDVDFHACPNCGVVQPEMTADVRSARYWGAMVVIVIGVAVALILGLTQVVTISTSAWIAAGTATLATLVLAWGAFYNPNGNRELNRSASQLKVERGALSLDEAGSPPDPMQSDRHEGLAPATMFAMATAVFCIVLAAAPPLLCMVGGWTQNDACYPAVVGPGDTTCFYFDQKIHSLNSYWKGTATAEVKNAKELGLGRRQLPGTTKKSSWGNTISTESTSNSTNTMWMNVEFPNDAELAGKKLELALRVSASYPTAVGRDSFDIKRRDFTESAQVTLSSPGAGDIYHKAWWIGQIATAVLFIIAGAILLSTCRALRSRANPVAVGTAEA